MQQPTPLTSQPLPLTSQPLPLTTPLEAFLDYLLFELQLQKSRHLLPALSTLQQLETESNRIELNLVQ